MGLQSYQYHKPLCFLVFLTLSRGTVILCTQSTRERQVLQAVQGLAAHAPTASLKVGIGSPLPRYLLPVLTQPHVLFRFCHHFACLWNPSPPGFPAVPHSPIETICRRRP
jgi:hypothetical protein